MKLTRKLERQMRECSGGGGGGCDGGNRDDDGDYRSYFRIDTPTPVKIKKFGARGARSASNFIVEVDKGSPRFPATIYHRDCSSINPGEPHTRAQDNVPER